MRANRASISRAYVPDGKRIAKFIALLNAKEPQVCDCNRDIMKAAEASITQRVGPWQCDAAGNKVLYVDSFGFRTRWPGECKPCYEAWKAAYEKTNEGMWD